MHPNVFVQPLDLYEHDHADLHQWIPTVNFRPPANGAPVKQTAVLVTTRRVADEELFLDYKLRPQGPLEAWYDPVDAAMSQT